MPQTGSSGSEGDPKPKVLVIGPIPPPVHGVTICIANLLSVRDRLDVDLVHLDSRFTNSAEQLGKFSLAKLFLFFRYLFSLIKLLLFGKIKLVVATPTFYFKPFLKDSAFIWVAWMLRKPVVGWIHNDFRLLTQEMTGWKLSFAKLTLKRLNRLVIVGEKLREFVPAWLSSDRIKCVPNGVPDPSKHHASNQNRLPPRFIYISQMNEAKGSPDLLAAAIMLASEGLTPEIVCYGLPAFETSQAMIESAFSQAVAKGANVKWHGSIYGDAKWHALAEADVFVFPSRNEAFPLAILDALAVGLPIIATDVGAVSDALDHEKGGYLIAPSSPSMMAAAIKALIANPDARKSMGEYNRNRYLTDFTLGVYAKNWNAFLVNECLSA